MVQNSFSREIQAFLFIRIFRDATVFLREYEDVCRKQQGIPNFVFLDYFLGMMYGSEVLERMFRIGERFELPTDSWPVVIGHSSNPMASQKLVAGGADFALPKIKHLSKSTAIVKAFDNMEHIQWMWKNRKLWYEPTIPQH